MNKENIQIKCADGFKLAATVYKPATIKAAVMIAPATGIKRGFYHSFATFLAEKGYGVLTYENRGIGNSVNGSINQGNPSLIAWGEQDMPAVLEELKRIFPQQVYHLVGHSAGGQLFGLMSNHSDIRSMFNFACSSGSIRNMRFAYKCKAIFFLNLFIPINNLLFGKSNVQWLGMGEPLPKAVGSQWRDWCNGQGYIATDFGKRVKRHFYDEIKIPSYWVHAVDDDIANYENVKDMIRVYPKLEASILSLEPSKLGYKEIGHMKFFSSKYKELWVYALNWLDKYSEHV